MAAGAVWSAPVAGAVDYECQRHPAPAALGSSMWTYGDFDLWVLEAGGQEFSFPSPGAGVELQTGNGAPIDHVRKCVVEAPVPVPEQPPVPTVTPRPEPTPAVTEPSPASTPTPEQADPTEEAASPTPASEASSPEPAVTPPDTPAPIEPGRVVDERRDPAAPVPAPPFETGPAPRPLDPLEPAESPVPPDAGTPDATPDPVAPDELPEAATPGPTPNAPLPAGALVPDRIVPYSYGDAQVLGISLARTGPSPVLPMLIAGSSLLVLGIAATAAGRVAGASRRRQV